ARAVDAAHLSAVGGGERSSGRLGGDASLLDDWDRQALRDVGLDRGGAPDLLPEEMLLFYQLVPGAGARLVLSYPAVDARGQELLPSSFLLAALDCFRPGAVPVERRPMLLQRL